jgi:4-hydroxybenzoate polyprenyltransferase
VADVVGGFDGVFASENGTNLKGQAKADALVAAFGAQGFDYIGNDAVDMPVWQAARSALATGCSARFMRRLNDAHPRAVLLSANRAGAGPYIRALRPHQWLKNLLLALPVVAGHDYSLVTLMAVIVAFMSFSLCASSVYIVNDILDLPHDRAHPEKRHRPFAAGIIPLKHGLGLFAVTAGLSLATALTLPWPFLLALGSYFALSMAYAMLLKRKLMIDVVALAALYGIRVLAGGAATGIVLSDWLVGFCFFMFLSLALVKRGTELVAQPETETGALKGRGYRPGDLPIVHALTVASGLVAVLILALYINSPEVRLLYSRPELLWGMCLMLVYWLGRMFLLTGRGEMRQDPVIFAVTDRNSLIAGAVVAAIYLLAV